MNVLCESLRIVHCNHKAPTPEPVDYPIPEQAPVPVQDPVPDHNPEVTVVS